MQVDNLLRCGEIACRGGLGDGCAASQAKDDRHAPNSDTGHLHAPLLE